MIENSPAVSGTQQGTVAIYADLMTEVKIRTSWIEYASQGRTGMDGQMVREFGFLQLRMICELIALACLVAHGDIAATKTTKLQSAFAANDIIKSLEKLNPSAFPVPHTMTTLSPGHHHFDARPDSDWMTKAELLKLYSRECGQALHKGNMRNLMKPRATIVKHFPELMTPAQRIMNLLGIHRIALKEGSLQFVCFLGGYNEDVRTIFGTAQ